MTPNQTVTRRQCLGALPATAWGWNQALAAEDSKVLRGATLDYPPLAQAGPGQVAGVAADLARAAMARAGWKLGLEMLPWPRAQDMVAKGQCDCLLTVFRTKAREQVFDFSSQPLLRQPIAFFARRNRTWSWQGHAEDIQGLGAAVVRGVHYGRVFEGLAPHLNLSVTERPRAPFLMLARGHVEIVVANVFLASHVLREQPALLQAVEMLNPVLEVVPSFMAFGKAKHRVAIEGFDAHIGPTRHALLNNLLRQYEVPQEWWAGANV